MTNFFNNLALRYKIMISPVLIIVLLALTSSIVALGLYKIGDLSREANAQHLPLMDLSTGMIENVAEQNVLLERYLNTHDSALEKVMAEKQVEFEALSEKLATTPKTDAQAAILKTGLEMNQVYVSELRNQLTPLIHDFEHILHKEIDPVFSQNETQLNAIVEASIIQSEQAILKSAYGFLYHASVLQREIHDFANSAEPSRIEFIKKAIAHNHSAINELEESTDSSYQNWGFDIGKMVAEHFEFEEDQSIADYFRVSMASLENQADSIIEITSQQQDISKDMENKADALAAEFHLLEESVKTALSDNNRSNSALTSSTIVLLGIVTLIGLSSGVLVSLWISKKITSPIRNLVDAMNKVSSDGDFSTRMQETYSQDEVGMMSRAFNDLLENMQEAIGEVNTAVSAVAKGDFGVRVQANLQGDLSELKNGVNNSIDTISNSMSEIRSMMASLAQGQKTTGNANTMQGEYRIAVDSANTGVEQVFSALDAINQVVEGIAGGDFSNRIRVELKGELHKLKTNLNGALDDIEAAMKEIVFVIQDQSRGNLNSGISGNYQGELATIKNAINTSGSHIKSTVSEIVKAAESVSTESRQISDGSQQLSVRIRDQAASIEQTAASMEEISNIVSRNAEHSTHASEMSHSARQQAIDGVKIVNDAIISMGRINDSSKEIGEIISLIDSIAFQINLLALNAAVEAARAGEHGRGFAVVASEVRELAEKSAQAARAIKSLIEDSGKKVSEGTQHVSDTGVALESISDAIVNVSQLIDEIASASKEQQIGVSQIGQAIVNIDHATQQSASMVEQASSSSQALNLSSEQMMELMSFFNINEKAA